MHRFASRPLLLLLACAALLRAAVLVGGYHQLHDDPDAYHALAASLATSGTLGLTAPNDPSGTVTPSAFRPPLYPALLAGLYRSIIAIDGDLQEAPGEAIQRWSRPLIAGLHWLLGVATVAITYLTAERWLRIASGLSAKERRLAALAAAGLVAIDPLLLQASVRVMTETLAALLVVIVLYAWSHLVAALTAGAAGVAGVAGTTSSSGATLSAGRVRLGAIAVGLTLAVAFLCRPTFLVWTVGLVGYLVLLAFAGAFGLARRSPGEKLRRRQPFGRACLLAAAWLTLTSSLSVIVWTGRNQVQLGQPVWATTHGGYTLLLGNNPSFFQYMHGDSPAGIAWDPEPFFQRWQQRSEADPRNASFWAAEPPAAERSWRDAYRRVHRDRQQAELFEDELAAQTAQAAIARDPDGFVRATLWRVGRLLSPMPQIFQPAPPRLPLAVWLVTAYYSFVSLLALWGIWLVRHRWFSPAFVAVPLLVLSLVAVHSVYWSNMRMRAPAVPAISLLAAVPLLTRRPHGPSGPAWIA